MLDKATLQKQLGRALSKNENGNLETYLDIATERLEELLCCKLSGEAQEERFYDPRMGYRSQVIDPFTDNLVVTINGDIVDSDDYYIRQNESYNGTWFNTIEFKNTCFFYDYYTNMDADMRLSVKADWGFGETLPADLSLVLARLFATVGKELCQIPTNVKSKSVEGFSVSYDTSKTLYDQFVQTNDSILTKYQQCDIGAVRHGATFRPFYARADYTL